MCRCLSGAPNWRPGPQPRHLPDWESNWRTLGSPTRAESTEPHQPGHIFNIFKYFIYLFLERGGVGEKRRRETLVWERNINWLPLIHPPIRDWAHNLGMWSDWESNWWPFALQHAAQPTEPHQSEWYLIIFKVHVFQTLQRLSVSFEITFLLQFSCVENTILKCYKII